MAGGAGLGVLFGTSALLTAGRRKDDLTGVAAVLVLGLVGGIGAGVLTWQRTDFPWYDVIAVVVFAAVGVVLCGGVVGVVGVAAALFLGSAEDDTIQPVIPVALAVALLLAGILIWGTGMELGLSFLAALTLLVVHAAVLAWLAGGARRPGMRTDRV